MTLFSLARRNIARNLRSYSLYFYSMTFSVLIFFTFISLLYRKDLIENSDISDKIAPALFAASAILFIFSASFIWYSNSYFIRRRKKEAALYALFGLEKKKIGKLLFYENLILGLLSLIIGIAAGSLFSKLFAMLLIKLMGFTIITELSISPKAYIHTFIIFFLMVLVTSIKGYFLIYRFTLLDLFKSERQGGKRGGGSLFGGIIAVLLMGTAYFLLLQPIDSSLWTDNAGRTVLFSLIGVIAGSYLFFKSLILVVLRWASKNEAFYYKGVNLISFSNIGYSLKGNIVLLTVISLLATITLFVFGAIFSMYTHTKSISESVNPISFIVEPKNAEEEKALNSLIESNKDNPLIFREKISALKIQADLSSLKRYPPEYPVYLIPESAFLELAEKMGISEVKTLGRNEAIAFYDGRLNPKHDEYTGKSFSLPAGNNVTIKEYKKYALLNQGIWGLPLVVSNEDYEEVEKDISPTAFLLYKIKNETKAETLSRDIEEVIYKDLKPGSELVFASFYKEYREVLETYGLLIFIGGFLGLVFLLATGSMIYFKQLTEALNDKKRFETMRKIGVAARDIRRSIARQNLIVFSLPLLLAICNSAVILSAFSHFLQFNVLVPAAVCMALYISIYFVYYHLTVSRYHRIVSG